MTTQTTERELAVAQHVGSTLNQLLWERRLTKGRAAQALGISPSTFSKKIRGQVPITVDELMTLARLLEVEPGQLLPPVLYAIRDSNPEPADRERHRGGLHLIWGQAS